MEARPQGLVSPLDPLSKIRSVRVRRRGTHELGDNGKPGRLHSLGGDLPIPPIFRGLSQIADHRHACLIAGQGEGVKLFCRRRRRGLLAGNVQAQYGSALLRNHGQQHGLGKAIADFNFNIDLIFFGGDAGFGANAE